MATILQDCLGELKEAWIRSGYPVVVLATSAEPEKIPQGVLSCFKHDISFEVCTTSGRTMFCSALTFVPHQSPAEAEREAILSNLLRETTMAPDVSLKSLATQTAAFVAADLVDLVRRSQNIAVQRTLSIS